MAEGGHVPIAAGPVEGECFRLHQTGFQDHQLEAAVSGRYLQLSQHGPSQACAAELRTDIHPANLGGVAVVQGVPAPTAHGGRHPVHHGQQEGSIGRVELGCGNR